MDNFKNSLEILLAKVDRQLSDWEVCIDNPTDYDGHLFEFGKVCVDRLNELKFEYECMTYGEIDYDYDEWRFNYVKYVSEVVNWLEEIETRITKVLDDENNE